MPVVLRVFVELRVKSLEIEPSNIAIINQNYEHYQKPLMSF